MATKERLIADVGSEQVTRIRENLNSLVTAVEALQPATIAASAAGGTYTAAEQTLINEMRTALIAMAAVDMTALRDLVVAFNLPNAPKGPVV